MKTSNKILLGLSLIAIGLFYFAFFVNAAEASISQLRDETNSGRYSHGINDGPLQGLGTGLTGSISSITWKASASYDFPLISLRVCTTSLCTATSQSYNFTIETDRTLTGYQEYIATRSAVTLHSDWYYEILFTTGTGDDSYIKGTTTDTYLGGDCYYYNVGVKTACKNGIKDIYFITDNDTALNTDTRIIWTYPTDNTEISSRSFKPRIDYYFNSDTHDVSTYSKILIQACSLINVTPFSNDMNQCERITFANGILTDELVHATVFSSISLNTNGAYLLVASYWNGIEKQVQCSWWEVLCTAQVPKTLTPSAININVATSAISFDDVLSATGLGSGKSTARVLCRATDVDWYPDTASQYLCTLVVALFYPDGSITGQNDYLNSINNQLSDRLPFALYFGPVTQLKRLTENEASTSFGTFKLPNGTGIATLSLDFKSFKDNYGHFLDVFSVPLSYIMWFWFAWYIFKDLTSKKA